MISSSPVNQPSSSSVRQAVLLTSPPLQSTFMSFKDLMIVLLGACILANLVLLILLKSLNLLDRWTATARNVNLELHTTGSLRTFQAEPIEESDEEEEEEEQGEYLYEPLVELDRLERFAFSVFWYRLCNAVGLIVLGIHWVSYQKYLDLRDLFVLFNIEH